MSCLGFPKERSKLSLPIDKELYTLVLAGRAVSPLLPEDDMLTQSPMAEESGDWDVFHQQQTANARRRAQEFCRDEYKRRSCCGWNPNHSDAMMAATAELQCSKLQPLPTYEAGCDGMAEGNAQGARGYAMQSTDTAGLEAAFESAQLQAPHGLHEAIKLSDAMEEFLPAELVLRTKLFSY